MCGLHFLQLTAHNYELIFSGGGDSLGLVHRVNGVVVLNQRCDDKGEGRDRQDDGESGGNPVGVDPTTYSIPQE